TPFFKVFLVTVDVSEIYMQEFWTTATVHHHSIQFKMDNKKHIVNLESFRLNIKIQRRAMRCIILGATPPKTKASVQKTKSSSDTTVTPPPTATAGIRLFTFAKGKQPATTSKAKNEGIGTISGVPDVPTEESNEEISWKSSDEGDDGDDDEERNDEQDDDDAQDDDEDQEEGSDDDQASDKEGEEFIHPSLSTHDEEETRDQESFDPIPNTPKNTDDKGNGEENIRMNVGMEEGQYEEDEENEIYRDVNINLGRGVQMADVHTTQEVEDSYVTLTPVNPDGQQHSLSVSSQFMTSMLNPTLDVRIESIFETSSQMDVQPQTIVASLPLSGPTLTPSTIATVTTIQQALTPSTIAPSTLLQDLPNFGSLFGFDH
nr:hypothetical protein [Tanacetum cinerariifolium]